MNQIGQGSIGLGHKPEIGSSPPFDLSSANNGVSVDTVSKKIVLGQDFNAPGDPGAIITSRELKLQPGTNLIITDSAGVVIAFFDGDNQISSFGYNLFGAETDRMSVFGPVNGVGEGIELKAVVRLNLICNNIVLIGNPPVTPGSFDILVRKIGGADGGQLQRISGASGSFTTVDLKTVTVTEGIITSIL